MFKVTFICGDNIPSLVDETLQNTHSEKQPLTVSNRPALIYNAHWIFRSDLTVFIRHIGDQMSSTAWSLIYCIYALASRWPVTTAILKKPNGGFLQMNACIFIIKHDLQYMLWKRTSLTLSALTLRVYPHTHTHFKWNHISVNRR